MASIAFDNIFDAVTNDKEEASELQTRADLMLVICDIVRENKWKQGEVTEKLELTQPRVSDLLNGKIEEFSVDMLITCLFRLGFRFKPTYKNREFTMMVQAVR